MLEAVGRLHRLQQHLREAFVFALAQPDDGAFPDGPRLRLLGDQVHQPAPE
jgi:hypothetical protein